ncbi:DUF2285 domain-containing protein [Sphingomonas sp. SUN019]|uniref:DNA -binding domain-containing protein n=1 Tax=Sphingomonas sp. SUN019 TaxID=2937788 RepID=UPI0021642D11|nr:DUF2285 domain-containing protein [Sphingomonas sp. SUN019]UVO50158.1 DUF2285 domain-containing protein [Sphingomonas sp. SUN019]
MVWTAAIDPGVLSVTARPRPRASFDLTRHRFDVVVDNDGTEHVAIHLPGGLLRLDVIAGTVLHGPADLRAHVELAACTPRQLASLDRLLRLGGMRDPGRRPPPPDRRLPRLIEALRIADALAQGASLAGIAGGLSADGHRSGDWPGDGEHHKSAIRRRVVLARRLLALGPAGVLGCLT